MSTRKKPCKLFLTRLVQTGNSTIGRLSIVVGGKNPRTGTIYTCATLEKAWENNARSVSRIPAGEYGIKRETDGRWIRKYRDKWGHKFIVELTDVPKRSEIQIHIGNSTIDSEGCILVGEDRGAPNFISNSVNTYKKFYGALAEYNPQGIVIVDSFQTLRRK